MDKCQPYGLTSFVWVGHTPSPEADREAYQRARSGKGWVLAMLALRAARGSAPGFAALAFRCAR